MNGLALRTAATAIMIVPMAYALQRLADAWFTVELDPALVPPSPHVALFWRIGVAGALALGVSGPLWRFGQHSPEGSVRLAEAAFWASLVLLVAQATFVP